jgi:hypothetical protein
MILKYFFKKILKIFQEFCKSISLKAITKAVKKQACVAHVISFAPFHYWILILKLDMNRFE